MNKSFLIVLRQIFEKTFDNNILNLLFGMRPNTESKHTNYKTFRGKVEKESYHVFLVDE